MAKKMRKKVLRLYMIEFAGTYSGCFVAVVAHGEAEAVRVAQRAIGKRYQFDQVVDCAPAKACSCVEGNWAE